MKIALEGLRSFRVSTEHQYSQKDVMLYALGLGLGTDDADLHFVYEEGLKVLPTFGGVLGYPGFWIKDHPELGMDWRKVLNGEQSLRMHKPLPEKAKVVGELRVTDVVDKGAGKDCLLYTTREVRDESGDLLCEVLNTVVLRGHGGFGGPSTRSSATQAQAERPQRDPDHIADFNILQQAALLYRLSGDYNPLHADPEVARSVGFPRAILHGAATWGIAGHILLRKMCGGDESRVREFGARFTAPVFPGETLRTEIWDLGLGHALFRCSIPARDKTVLDMGEFNFKPD
ncbi:MaoC family dehydratase N-terminal domain-containing protein [Alcaligenaceae bacterium]|nr:MaoC family dehydratase N-terminal domain-containing protein [Alcaligenaceae bacterium]